MPGMKATICCSMRFNHTAHERRYFSIITGFYFVHPANECLDIVWQFK
ncbi:MAG: hypothetical protein ACD_75C01948G0009 [uncultured bacterium]|nr:MAG: hypothetical protein ACD_75C01948G0009 [uncultured bacterium]